MIVRPEFLFVLVIMIGLIFVVRYVDKHNK